MADTFAEFPDRDVFKASEVCEIAKVQPYVLRSWEQEFPNLGVARSASSPRLYRRADVERVLRIKHLVFGEGLTLAGARRRLDGDDPVVEIQGPGIVDDQTRARLAGIRQELRALLQLLDKGPGPLAAQGHVEDPQPLLPEMADSAEPGQAGWPPKGHGGGRKGAGRSR